MKISIFSILFCLLLLGNGKADAQRCFYRSFQDLDSGRCVSADFRMQRLSPKKLRKHLGPEYKLKARGKLAKELERNALFLQVDSELFVNCRSLKCEDVPIGKGFAPCQRIGSDRIVFFSVRRDQHQKKEMPSLLEKMLLPDDDYEANYARPEVKYKDGREVVEDHDDVFNRLGYALDSKSAAKKRLAKVKACYFLFKVEPTEARIVDTSYMRYLLAPYPDLQTQYLKLDRSAREDPIVILQYLRQIKL